MEKGSEGQQSLELSRLETPRSGPHDLKAFKDQILSYKGTHAWYHRALLNDGQEGKEIARALTRLAIANLGRVHSSAWSEIAERLGVPFESPRSEEQRRKRLWDELDKLHPVVDGTRRYVPPGKVLHDHAEVYEHARKLFGSYPAAMNAWQPGSYDASVKHHRKKFFDRKRMLQEARITLRRLFREHDYVSHETLRCHYKPEYALVRAAMRKNGFKKYTGFIESQLPEKYRSPLEGEYKLIGNVGELFSFAWFFLQMRENPFELRPCFPFYDKRLQVYAPQNRRSETGKSWPDVGILDFEDCALHLTEIKAGFNYTRSYAKFVIEKYESSPDDPVRLLNENEEKDETKVVFDSVHLHFSQNRIEDGVLDLFKECDIAVVTSAEFRALFEGGLGAAYDAFISKPLQFVRAKHHLGLEDLVLQLAPDATRDKVLQQRAKDRQGAEQYQEQPF